MSYRIALNFEDGVTRFIDCNSGETVLDAAYRARINLPMDCSDGVCGTCKCHCESGDYDLGDDFIEEALTEDEANDGLILTCQMKPESDCVVTVPVPSTACKAGIARFEARLVEVLPLEDAAIELTLEASSTSRAPVFLPGQYVNIEVPGSGEMRAYSFSSAPGLPRFSFLIKRVPGGVMGTYLDAAREGEQLKLTGPLGSFYLREPSRPILMLAGGTGLAPMLSMLDTLASTGCEVPVRLFYGASRDQDLVLLDRLEQLRTLLPDFEFLTSVSAPDSRHPRKGYVTDHLSPSVLNNGDVDVYLCGPPPMVDAVRGYLAANNLVPAGFHYEKFTQARTLAA